MRNSVRILPPSPLIAWPLRTLLQSRSHLYNYLHICTKAVMEGLHCRCAVCTVISFEDSQLAPSHCRLLALSHPHSLSDWLETCG
jgi:hypothetical protein